MKIPSFSKVPITSLENPSVKNLMPNPGDEENPDL